MLVLESSGAGTAKYYLNQCEVQCGKPNKATSGEVGGQGQYRLLPQPEVLDDSMATQCPLKQILY